MALGFKVADGYVEVHANYNKGDLQKAAQQAADDSDKAYNKERVANSKSGETRNANRQIGRQANADFVQGVREQVNRQKETPFIKVEDVKKDMSRLGRVSVMEFHHAADEDVKRSGRWRQLGSRIAQHLKSGILGKDNAGVAGIAFFKRFVEAATFGQADFSSPKITGKLSKTFAMLGTAAGVTFAGFLIAEIGNAITGALPVLLGVGLAALPIIGLIRTGMTKEKGHWKTELNQMGRALHTLVVEFKSFMKVIEVPMKAPVLNMLVTAGASLKTLAPILASFFRSIGPGLQNFTTGAFSMVINFFKALLPIAPVISKALSEWGAQLPRLGTALGSMFADILKDPDKVVQAIKDLFSTLRALAVALGVIVGAATTLARWMHILGGAIISVARFVMQAGTAWQSFKNTLSAVWNAIKSVATTVWNAIKTAVTTAWTAIKSAVTTGINAVWQVIQAVGSKIVSVWKALWNSKLLSMLRNALGLIKDVIKLAWTAILVGMKVALGAIAAVWKKAWTGIKTAASTIWKATKAVITAALNAIKALFAPAVNWIKAKLAAGWAAIKAATAPAWNAVKTIISKAWTAIKTAVSNGINAVMTLIRGIKAKVTGALSGAGSWLLSAGKAIINGLIDGINSKISAVRSKLQSLTALIKASKGPPERDKVLLFEAGQLIMHGLMRGIDSKTGALQSQLGGLTNSIPGMAGVGGATYNQQSSWSPTIIVNANGSLNSLDASGKRTLTKELFLALEQYRKDYVR